MPAILYGRRPARTELAGRTSRLLLVPIDLDMLGVKTAPFAGLPVIVEARWAQQIHAVVVRTVHEQGGVQEAGVHARGPRQETPLRQRGVELGGCRSIGCRAGRGFAVRNQVRPIILTGFGDRHFVAHPLRRMLTGIGGFGVVLGAAERGRGRKVRGLAPLELSPVPAIIWAPHPAQDGDRRDLAPPGRGRRVIDGREPPPAVVAERQRQGSACRWRGREPSLLGPPRLAVFPLRGTHGAHPCWDHDGKTIQGMPQRFAHHLDAVQGPHRGQEVRGVGALAASCHDQWAIAAPREQGIDEQRRHRPRDEARAKFTEDRGIAPGIRALQAQDVLPVNATAHRVGRLAIGESFGTWQDRDKRQPPRGLSGLPMRGEQRAKGLIRQ